MDSELIYATLASVVLLTPAAYAAYRAAHAQPRTSVDSDTVSGECSGADCPECLLLFRHPSQAGVRQAIAKGIPAQTRQGR